MNSNDAEASINSHNGAENNVHNNSQNENNTSDAVDNIPATETPPVAIDFPEILLKLSEDPVLGTCPYCKQVTTTVTEHTSGPLTLLGAVYLAHCFLCCVPFFVDRFLDVNHRCSMCRSVIGRFKRM